VSAPVELTGAEEAMRHIAEGQPPLTIRKYFKSFKEAVQFYAQVRGKQFGFGSATDRCCGCGQPAGDVIAEIQWAAPFSENSIGRVILMALAIAVHAHIHSKTRWIGFSAFHGFCPACWSRYRALRIVKGFLDALTLVMIFGGLAFAAGFGTAPLVLDHLSSTNGLELWLACGGCVATAGLGTIIRIAYRQLGVPAPIRSIAPRPFRLMRTLPMQKITLPDSPPRVVHIPRYRPANSKAMSRQQTVGVLLTIFVGLPAAFMAFAARMDPQTRQIGYTALAAWVAIIVVLTVWHKKLQRKIRSAYYATMAAQLANR